MMKTLIYLLISIGLFFSHAVRADTEMPRIAIEGQYYTMQAPQANSAQLAQLEQALQQILTEQETLSADILNMTEIADLENAFERYFPLMQKQDQILLSIVRDGIYQRNTLYHFIQFREKFARTLERDFQKFADTGVLPKENVARFLSMYNVNSGEYKKIFIELERRYF